MSNQGDQSNVVGVGLSILGILLLSSMDAVVKNLLEGGLSVMQMLAMRSWVVLPVLVIWGLSRGGLETFKTQKKAQHFVRVFCGFGAPFFFFNSLTTLHLAEATVIFFSATFIMTGLSVPILKEKVGVHRWSAIVVGFIGILIANNPSGDVLNMGALYAFAAAISYSLMILFTRKTGSGEGTFKMLFYFHAWIGLVASVSLGLGLGGLEFMALNMTPQLTGAGGIVLITVLVIAGHVSLIKAFTIAPIGLLAPFEYLGILWSAFYSYLGWGYVPSSQFWIGASLVIASGIYMVFREIKVKKLGRAPIGPVADLVAEAGPMAAPIPPSISVDRDPS